jgi:hypothetical protein
LRAQAKAKARASGPFDAFRSLDETVSTLHGYGIQHFLPQKRNYPGENTVLEPAQSVKRPKLFLFSDREAEDLQVPFWLLYVKGMRGSWSPDPLHDQWNVTWSGISATGMTSVGLGCPWLFVCECRCASLAFLSVAPHMHIPSNLLRMRLVPGNLTCVCKYYASTALHDQARRCQADMCDYAACACVTSSYL